MKIFFKNIPLFLFLLLPFFAEAKEVPPAPNPPKLVNDFAGILSSGEVQALEQKLVAYDDSTSTQIAVVIEETLDGDDVFDYSHRLATAWGIGREGKNNGILIYIAIADRKLWIQTGYGTEGFLPDALAKRIIERIIAPNFRNQNYYQGLDQATTAIIQLGNGEYVNDDPRDSGNLPIPVIIIFLVLFIVIIIIISKGGGGGGYNRRGRYDAGGGWIMFGPGGGSGWGGGGGSSGWGGGGGGGFGGFGGGGFGGGGAGGSW
ncbi:MAG: TPM domain-containing protein [Saprospiraceae bacterium]|nr:TPM domain-containing protein [Saprospiraceae bacterium]MCF8251197.1 TPM domain-containing protein [Saprospiraceae bacterium]MCF8282370.1 TPM domain-containing protein [Bacteroidales bacterium]MCF8313009.1 TPM domain-containing protein [Saprospiraceae bacterium]MCF8441456.1 TPM domain-containing protein [Saprospiraceae bacterium]